MNDKTEIIWNIPWKWWQKVPLKYLQHGCLIYIYSAITPKTRQISPLNHRESPHLETTVQQVPLRQSPSSLTSAILWLPFTGMSQKPWANIRSLRMFLYQHMTWGNISSLHMFLYQHMTEHQQSTYVPLSAHDLREHQQSTYVPLSAHDGTSAVYICSFISTWLEGHDGSTQLCQQQLTLLPHNSTTTGNTVSRR
jgi:hypothetical protein